MTVMITREKLLKEINLIPDEKLREVYEFLHYFRLGLEVARPQSTMIMQFAGCWQDMPADTFADFTDEIATRRQQAFSRRRDHETRLD